MAENYQIETLDQTTNIYIESVNATELIKSLQEKEPEPNKDGIMISSATIIGFTGLGFIIGVRFSEHKDVRKQLVCLTCAYGFIIIEISLHLLVILWAFQNVLSSDTYEQVIYATIILITLILICFALIAWFDMTSRQKSHKRVQQAREEVAKVRKDLGIFINSTENKSNKSAI